MMTNFALSRNWKMYFGICCLVCLTLAIYSLTRYPSWNLGDGLVFLGAILVAASYFAHLFDNLSINREGFEYRSSGTIYSGNWTDVRKVAVRKYFVFYWVRYEGFYIPKEKLTSGKTSVWVDDFFVPLSPFVVKWRENTLGQQLKEYAPQIYG